MEKSHLLDSLCLGSLGMASTHLSTPTQLLLGAPHLGNHVLEGLHDLGALGLLVVGEAAGDDDHGCQHDAQVQLRGDAGSRLPEPQPAPPRVCGILEGSFASMGVYSYVSDPRVVSL